MKSTKSSKILVISLALSIAACVLSVVSLVIMLFKL